MACSVGNTSLKKKSQVSASESSSFCPVDTRNHHDLSWAGAGRPCCSLRTGAEGRPSPEVPAKIVSASSTGSCAALSPGLNLCTSGPRLVKWMVTGPTCQS
jgi:hypothetical protein